MSHVIIDGMGHNRWYLTSVLLGFLILSLGVLGARWNVLAQRLPIEQSTAAYSSDRDEQQQPAAGTDNPPAADDEDAAEPAGLYSNQQQQESPAVEETAADSDNAAAASGGSKSPATPAGKIDINSAGLAELDSLPGIGPKLAAAIIEHRSTNGRFATVETLLDVPGIGEAKLAELRPHVEAR